MAVTQILQPEDPDDQLLNLHRQGTGSYPPCEKGLHRTRRHPASILPFSAPYFSTA